MSKKSITLPIDDNLKFAIEATTAFKSADRTRPMLTCINFEADPPAGKLTLTSSDSFSAISVTIPIPKDPERKAFTVAIDPEGVELRRTVLARTYQGLDMRIAGKKLLFDRRQFVAVSDEFQGFPMATLKEYFDNVDPVEEPSGFSLGLTTLDKVTALAKLAKRIGGYSSCLTLSPDKADELKPITAMVHDMPEGVEVQAMFMPVRVS